MSALELSSDGGGYPSWSPLDGTRGVAFVGRGPARPREDVLAAATGLERPVAWLDQVHGGSCLPARPGRVGQADALTTERRDLALAISTADCVPVVLIDSTRVTAIHAGWRGVVAGVVERAVQTFAGSAAPRAWIGPAIGACCYEVGSDVAERVLAACDDPSCVRQDPAAGSRPHLDLGLAVRAQLRRGGVEEVGTVGTCTRCDPRLHSFRRDGAGGGRNLAFAWLESR